jgi:phage shock protein C
VRSRSHYFSTRSDPEYPDDPITTSAVRAAAGLPEPRLWRSRGNRVVAGVLGGLAEKFGLEPRPLRILYGLLTLASGGLLAIPYVAIWTVTKPHGAERSVPRLWRSRSDRVIGGVLGGMAEKFEINSTFLRVLYVALSVFSAGFPGTLVYLVLWMVTPRWDVARTGTRFEV